MPSVLLVDDEPALREALSMALGDAGFDVTCAPDGARALAIHQQTPHDLLVSDVNMPHMDGFQLCRRLRAAGDPVPVVLLTSRVGEIDEALGLDLGADDYVTKPFSTRVLVARIRALLRRGTPRPDAAPIRTGALVLDRERLEPSWNGAPFRTTLTEFRLLECLAARPGVVYERAALLERIRGDDSVVAPRLVDTYIRRLRRTLEAMDPTFDRIETVVGAGYRWRA